MRGLSSSLLLSIVCCLCCNDSFQTATARQQQFRFHQRRKLVNLASAHIRIACWHDLQGGHQDQDDTLVETPDNDNDNHSSSTSSSTTTNESPNDSNKRDDTSNLFGMLSSAFKTKTDPQNIKLIRQRLEENKERLLSAFGPSLVAFWANRGGSSSDRLVSFASLYALSLLGSSIGFYCFLYFITVGYALGITIPMITALYIYIQRHFSSQFIVSPECAWHTPSTLLHSGLIILWGLRALFFFVWREYFNWPELHKQIKHVNQHNSPTLPVKCLIWIIYSFLYTAMLAPGWLRLEQSARLLVPKTTTILMATSKSGRIFQHPFRWTCMYLPILFQIAGLLLETVADYQKSAFKKDHRYEWCHVGLWKWSTHPNYLGEMIFWTGTYLGWCLFIAALYLSSTSPKTLATLPSTLSWIGQFIFCTMGYFFITTVLRGSIRSMGNKHWQKYGHLQEYAAFRQSHGLLGPKNKWRRGTKPTEPATSLATAADEETSVVAP